MISFCFYVIFDIIKVQDVDMSTHTRCKPWSEDSPSQLIIYRARSVGHCRYSILYYDLADGRPANGVWVVPYKTEDKRGDISNVVAEAAVYSLLLHAENENKTRKNNVWPVGEQWTEGKY
jgi:hypothetical protein